MPVEKTNVLTVTEKPALVVGRIRFSQEQSQAIERMPEGAGEALRKARPEAQFGESPVMTEEHKTAIAGVIEKYQIRPPRGWILIKQVPAAERIGLVLVPQAAEQPPEIGIVIAVGQGTIQNGLLVPPEVKIGDHITFPKFAGLEVKIAGETLTQLREDEVLLISGRPGGM